MKLATKKDVNAGDLARSVMLLLPDSKIRQMPDPGEPGPEDREVVTLKSGPSAGKPWRRKPRLQVRLPDGYASADIRKALSLALAMDDGKQLLSIESTSSPTAVERLKHSEDEIERLRTIVSALSFTPLNEGVRNKSEALYILGFPPNRLPEPSTVNAKFRMLASIHHPDSPYGDHRRMSQLNEAVGRLRKKN